jgi:hypothetical protein
MRFGSFEIGFIELIIVCVTITLLIGIIFGGS